MNSARSGTKDQRGTALIEMAIAAPLLILLVFGILEFGLAFQDRLTVSNGTQSAGRVAAALGNAEDADIATLQAVEQSLGLLANSGEGVIKHVQIWRSDGSGNPLSPCVSPGNGGPNCNWYEYKPLTLCRWQPCPDPAVSGYSYGGGFLPVDRDVTLNDTGPNPGLDIVGVTVLFSHDWITGVLPMPDVTCEADGTKCWADTALFRLEPQNFGD
ncbi:MAG: TadE/TadG family type IV pilus assembly protein [Acidimicrobiia bacterium]